MVLSLFLSLLASCNSAYRLRYWNNLMPCMGLYQEYQVATVLTACGIETIVLNVLTSNLSSSCNSAYRLRYWNLLLLQLISFRQNELQQCLPLAVLKQISYSHYFTSFIVATVLTACGIETCRCNLARSLRVSCNSAYRLRYWNVGIGTDTFPSIAFSCNSAYRLRYWNWKVLATFKEDKIRTLQQCLPLAVLKRRNDFTESDAVIIRCNSAYRLRYWNSKSSFNFSKFISCCNSAYRLRYWNDVLHPNVLQTRPHRCNSAYRLRYWNITVVSASYSILWLVATVLTACGIETPTLAPGN